MPMNGSVQRIAITPGEPAGIGPDLVAMLARYPSPVQRVVIADPELLLGRARLLGIELRLQAVDFDQAARADEPGCLHYLPDCRLHRPVTPGRLDTANAGYVLRTLDLATDGCLDGRFSAMVTGPVHKGVINDAGIAFTGHTEYLAGRCGAAMPVMMLATEGLKVALVTTHLPLAQVPAAITPARLESVLRILHHDLRERFGVSEPRILVCGLNPHAGEGGHLGDEEIRVIEPVLNRLRGEGMVLVGPMPADTLFTPRHLEEADAVLAMYHDQGLPVLKHMGFGRAVNITLGLPIIRTSVDHGTALDIAGSGRAEDGSLREALAMAVTLCAVRARALRSSVPEHQGRHAGHVC